LKKASKYLKKQKKAEEKFKLSTKYTHPVDNVSKKNVEMWILFRTQYFVKKNI